MTFGPAVTISMRRAFWRLIAEAVPRLAVSPYDLGRFEDPRYRHEISIDDVTPISQPSIRLAHEAERWL